MRALNLFSLGMKYLIKSHPVVFDCLVILPRLEMDITHVHFEFSRIIKHPVLGYHLKHNYFKTIIEIINTSYRISIEGLCIHFIVIVLTGEVE